MAVHDHDADDDLRSLLKETRRLDWRNRLNAVKALGDLGPAARTALREILLLLADSNEAVQGTAVVALTKIRPTGEDICAPLISLILGKSESLSKMASMAIKRLIPHNVYLVPALVAAVKEALPFKRCRLVTLLGQIGPPANEAFPDLFELLQGPLSEDFIYSYALEAMTNIGLPKRRDLTRIFNALKDRSGNLRPFALPPYDDQNTVIRHHVLPLFKTTLDKYFYLHYQMITLLASSQVGIGELVPPLCQALAHPDQLVRRYAAESFSFIGPAGYEAIPALIWGLKDDHHEVRFYCAEALGYIGTTAYHAIPALNDACHDPDAAVRESATDAIAKIHNHSTN